MRMDKELSRRSGNRIEQKMREQDYEKLSVFILSVLERAGSEGMTLHDLVQEAQQRFNADFKGNVSWYLREVKHDLELRKLILKTISPKREQIIRLNSEKKWWFN
ncbi:MAG TPA: hypothetical protein PLM56_01160 [Cyclobacteriaceae bacterium]|nr:hypothetical protein [Cyclobacteriaceae bacterium]HRF32077.1 hypothetical protein [Cyclobacteriaceae bacterium]